MRKAEIILLIVSVIAILMNILHFPFGGLLSVLCLSILAMIYFYFGIALFNDIKFRYALKKDSYKFTSSRKIWGAIATGVALCMTIIGIMFKIQSWPGAELNLWPGLIALFIISIIAAVKFAKDRTWYYKRIFLRIAIFGTVGIGVAIIPPITWLEMRYKDYPDYVEALKKSMEDPQNEELLKMVEAQRVKMNEE
jgi:hypothetical protein